MSRHINLENIFAECIGDCLDCPFNRQNESGDYCVLNEFPTIDIVHCKDCKWSESNGSNTDGYFCHHGHHNPLYQVFSLHFCSYGERIDNE